MPKEKAEYVGKIRSVKQIKKMGKIRKNIGKIQTEGIKNKV